jgi:putative ABC transport system ATP-binding protein
MTATVPILQACHVRKVFSGGVVALDGVDMDVAPGEWLAITGASGSGKTTLLQLFAALDKPDSGRVLYKGDDIGLIKDLNAYRRRSIGVIFQLHNLLPHLDVRDNIEVAMLGSHVAGRLRADRVTELVCEVGLEDQQLRKPPELSGGERQRAAIARALANSPEVLLADEPTGSLDPDHVARLVDLLDQLNRQRGVTIVMVTHDQSVAARAGRIVSLVSGRLVGTSSERTRRAHSETSSP